MSKPDTIRLGLVGFGDPYNGHNSGRGGNVFQQAISGFDGVIPTAVCDISKTALAAAKEVFPKIKTFADFDQMLASVHLDALIIGTPANLHTEFAVKALKKNIHVLSEIPSVTSAGEAATLWEAHKTSRAFYMTGSNPAYKGWVQAAVELKRKGLFGDLIYAEASYIHDLRSYFKRTPWRATYAPILYCTHSLTPILRLIDEDFDCVACFDTGSHINKKDGQHDVMTALLRTPSNVVAHLTVSWINNYRGGSHFSRYFTTKGCFEQTPNYQTLRKEPAAAGERTLFYSSELPLYNNWIELPVGRMPPAYAGNPKAHAPGAHGGIDYAMLDAFIGAVRSNGPSPISLRDGLRMSLPGIYAAESARQGGELVRIKYPWEARHRGA